MKLLRRILLQFGLLFVFSNMALADSLITIPTRDNVTLSYWWMPREAVKANLILMSGGSGGIGYRDGIPQSDNFLIRSREHFASGNPLAKFNVALMGNSSDMRQLNPETRAKNEHVTDIAALVAHIRTQNSAPIWLVGTSQGTISAAAAGIALGNKIEGIIFSAPITLPLLVPTSLSQQPIHEIKVPAMVIFHEKDSCRTTRPEHGEAVLKRLSQSKPKKFLLISGGDSPSGEACQALHWHGFINMEAQAALVITNWILNPQP